VQNILPLFHHTLFGSPLLFILHEYQGALYLTACWCCRFCAFPLSSFSLVFFFDSVYYVFAISNLFLILLVYFPSQTFYLFVATEVWIQGLGLVTQSLCHSSRTVSPFCFGYFLNRVSLLCMGWPGSKSFYLCFPHSWNDRYVLPCPAF
jgi:hypothetical protein